MRTADRLQDGQPFGRYQIVRLIGEGGMGAVYEAMHPVLKKRFAIKTLLPSMARTPEVRARFLREGEAASRINHPNVVDVSDVGTEGDTPYLVMEFLEGENLADLIGKRGRLDVAEALDLLLPVVSAVVAGHDKGVVHRDLKPQNVFLARGHWGESIPKVLDFGVSKLTGGDNSTALTGTLAILGTASYMSPEQARGARNVDGQSDQYSLGLVLYEMLTGKRAHPGENQLEVLHNIANGELIPPQRVRPDLPPALLAAVTRMLALAPADRFPSLRAAGRALLPLASSRMRVAIPDAFRDPATAPTIAASPGPSGSTLVFDEKRPPSAPAGGTQLLPDAPGSRVDTTFSRAASQVGPTDAVRGKGNRARWIAGGLGIAAAAAGVWVFIGQGKPSPAPGPAPPRPVVAVPDPPAQTKKPPAEAPKDEAPASRRLLVRVQPENAEIRLDDLPAVRGRLDRAIPDDEAAHSIRVTAPGHEPMTIALRPHEPAPAEIKLTPTPAPRPPRHEHKRKESASNRGKDAAPAVATPTPAKPPEPATPRYGANKALIIH
jgi:serine/threonine-protein kinase